jgi:hypothetical protein
MDSPTSEHTFSGSSIVVAAKDQVSADLAGEAVVLNLESGVYCVPAATCLTQALATQVLLDQRGQTARTRIGVVKGEDGQLQAHAWVESEGVVVIGGSESEIKQYTPLLALDGVVL